ncbi:UPF0235 protein C15orf40 homolog [Tachypleus tridentatus]|uniref:UPF0235 protein C15orf40 homolog n=1 Tax=Tachypleus tridentatus TaxID=6853 RepID=UPI003FD008C5
MNEVLQRYMHVLKRSQQNIIMPRQKIKAAVNLRTLPENKDFQINSAGKKNEKPCQPMYTSAVLPDSTGKIIIKLHAKPGAKENMITSIDENVVSVQVAAPPVDGEANNELVGFIAELLGVRKRNVVLEKGFKSREKTLSVTADELTISTVLEKLRSSLK